ncbi:MULTISPECIES: cAMP-activated global transcriptional regulator CRP [Methylophaga]|jgi:CRP/FNR family cyclic AMP-dependent transcriptional regulator|uniref:cAMP-activated global transcriptional regulator CRP n=2 Tax=Methylophaga TaxID=40222 RepID=A0ABN0TDH8_9GAMM|nr:MULTISPECIES: cAMP-activated global transcriptional regulator CRP [Methylophaga]MAX50987.1 cAMP-activated global transcriptional regulator CRP [Methylophaga sp.]BDZ72578.1 CRP-like protein Clp [Methylophaga marina]GLP98885.1 CRP-like protein Clp [Methylophaga thalassica]|tara:strand:- start:6202 stop:6888 length:687 start_codon:yes stop_codon:yes gene_type:complete
MDYHRHKAIEQGLAEFFRCCHTKTYPAKNIIVRPGDPPHTLYYIREGSVSVCMENEEGEELIVAYLNQGDFIGEIGMFSDVGERMVTVRARTDVRTEEISYQQIMNLSKTQLKECYPTLLFTIAEQLAKRLLSTTRKATDMAFLDVAGRVEAALHELAAQPDAMRHPDGMQIKVTRQEISRMVGCSREMVGRVLKELQDNGLLWAKGKTMIIYDEEHRHKKPLVKKLG